MIKDKVVIITGASSGIGEASAKKLASEGAKVVLAARRLENLKKVADDIINAGGQAVYKLTDVTNKEDNLALVAFAKEKFNHIDAIFLNAGLMPSSPLSALEVDNWDVMIDVNIKGVLYGIAAILPEFTSQKSGHVLVTSSVAGLKSYPGSAVYGATKWAVRNLMEVLRMESAMAGTNIRTATIYPAAIKTELLSSFTDEGTLTDMSAIYEQFEISPERVANVVSFAIDQPEDTNISEFTIGPTTQPW